MKGVNMSLSFQMTKIYDQVSFQFDDLDKVGIVGVNGAGKTTLFHVIMGDLFLDEGTIMLSKKKRIGYLAQELSLDDQELVVFDYLMSARPIASLEQELHSLYHDVALETDEVLQKRLLKKIGNVQELLEYYDCYQAENILFELISKMNIDGDLLDMRLSDLSGGQKSKIAFAHLLYSNPEILLLDEPTNHLDVDTRDFVIQYLKKYKGMVLIISHDVNFLNQVTNKTLYIDKANHSFVTYDGNYSVFMKKYEKQVQLQERIADQQDREIEKLRAFVLQYSNSSGKRKRIAQSREKLLDKKLKEQIGHSENVRRVKFQLQPKREGSKIPVKVNGVTFGYCDNHLLIQNLSFIIQNRERFLIIGENGVGKSTLLKLIISQLKPLEGNIWLGSKTDIAYYAQEQESLDLERTILENVDQSGYSPKEIRTILGSFLFFGDDVFKKVSVLSPGEKARVALCKVMLEKANLLVLDEPTNHLDPETMAIIGENFKNYEGTILLVSHNPAFVESIGIDRMLILPSGKIVNYDREQLEYYYRLNTR